MSKCGPTTAESSTMAAVPTEPQVREMIVEAMRDRAPGMYRELTASGEFGHVVQARVDLFDEIFATISSEATTKVLGLHLPFEEGVAMLEAADRLALEQALAAALEFPPGAADDDDVRSDD